jgi:RNA polymerase sigma-70 factor (ECF subfamily)
MNGPAPPGSSTLLLLRLCVCPTDGAAWDQFVRRYSGSVYRWCRRCRLQDADARDVTQNVFVAVFRSLQRFDRSRAPFRSWLYRVVQNAVRDWCKKPERRVTRGTQAAWEALASEPARLELRASLNEEFDLELLELAEANVRLQVGPQTWDAYRLRCKEGLPLRTAAERIGIPAGYVSKYALRVRDLVARQVARLEGLYDSEEGRRTEGQHDRLSAGGQVAGLRPRPAQPVGRPAPHRPRPDVQGL